MVPLKNSHLKIPNTMSITKEEQHADIAAVIEKTLQRFLKF